MSVDHYENFPVASLLCPPRLRPAVAAIYWFARTADDLADEGDAPVAQRLDALREYRADLAAVVDGRPPSARWTSVFEPLARTLREFQLPAPLLHDLLSAFEQDLVKHRYGDRAELLDYCRRSANPIGRLLLRLYGIDDEPLAHRSDAICTALQLANFWQDLGTDLPRGRLYLPATDLASHRVDTSALLDGRDSPALRSALAEMVRWTRELLASGADLVHRIPGRAGWELRLVVQGGLRILEKIERMQYATLQAHPRLRWFDLPLLAWRAVWMRPQAPVLAGTTP